MLLCKMNGNPEAMWTSLHSTFCNSQMLTFFDSVQSVIIAQFSWYGQCDPVSQNESKEFIQEGFTLQWGINMG